MQKNNQLKTVLIPPICDWNFLTQLPQQIALQFAKNGYRVYYCNTNITNHEPSKVPGLDLYIYYNYNELLQRIKNKEIKVDILYNTWAKNYNWVDLVNPKLVIYHSCDNFVEWHKYESLMIEKSDIVLCTAQKLYDTRKKQHNNVHLVRNGCNVEMVESNYDEPEDLNNIIKDRAVFMGAIGKWVNTNILKTIGNQFPVVLLGIEHGKPKPSNIIDLGEKDHSILPSYLNNFKVGLIPFIVNSDITQNACPIKMYEYLACGLPVVATSWIETEIPDVKGVVFTSNDKDEFLNHVENIMMMTDKKYKILSDKCREVAKNHTWEKRFEHIQNIINKVV